MPAIEKLHKTYKDKGLVVLGIDSQDDDLEAMREFYKRNSITFPTAADPTREVSDHYGVNAIPTTVIYDRKGRIAAQLVGDQNEEQFLRLLRKAGLR